MDELLRLNGRTALVSGGTRGIGRAISFELARAGASVVALFLENSEAAFAMKQDADLDGLVVVPIQCDVTELSAVIELADTLHTDGRVVDIVVNNARRAYEKSPALDLNWNDYNDQILVSLGGALNLAKAFAPGMAAQRWGRIINILSTATVSYPVGHAPYVCGKEALYGFATSLAVELGEFGITVNSVSPGRISGPNSDTAHSWFRDRAPLRRNGTPTDVARAVLALASELSSFITGDCVTVDGGLVRSESSRR